MHNNIPFDQLSNFKTVYGGSGPVRTTKVLLFSGLTQQPRANQCYRQLTHVVEFTYTHIKYYRQHG